MSLFCCVGASCAAVVPIVSEPVVGEKYPLGAQATGIPPPVAAATFAQKLLAAVRCGNRQHSATTATTKAMSLNVLRIGGPAGQLRRGARQDAKRLPGGDDDGAVDRACVEGELRREGHQSAERGRAR